jgi:hypothetical protein
MFDNEYYIRIKNEAEPSLFAKPGVRAVGLGPKLVKDKPIKELAIQVYVEEKKSIAALRPDELIPRFIGNIPTDVLVWSAITKSAGEITVGGCKTAKVDGINLIKTGTTITAVEIHSPAHGLFNNVWVRFTGPDYQLANIAFQVTVIGPDHFRINTVENGMEKNPFNIPYVSGSSGWLLVSNINTLCCCPSGEIQTILTSDKVEITSTAHGLLNGDTVKIRKLGPTLETPIYKIEKTDDNNFRLAGANPAHFTGIPTGWRWFKVSMCLTGRITRVQKTNPVIIHSAQHGLKNKDTIVIVTLTDITKAHLDNLVSTTGPDPVPYEVSNVTDNTFTISKVDASTWTGPEPVGDVIGSWIKVTEDNRKYSRIAGGMRIQVEEFEKTTLIPPAPGDAFTTRRFRTEISYNIGTLGCIATHNIFNKKVLLSNAHVLFSGGNNNEVHHPDYYVSSKTCSSHKIANRLGMVYGRDPETQFTVDAAIAEFEGKIKYDPFIQDIGPVKGTATILPTDLANGDFRVWKRGAMTQITEGIVISTDLTYPDTKNNMQWVNQIKVMPISGLYRGIMCVHGDSGSVLVNKDNMVVGLIHQAGEDGSAFANHIKEVEDALNITIWKEGDPLTMEEQNGLEEEQQVSAGIPRLFASAMSELKQTENGNLFVGLLHTHYPGLVMMLNNNKRFALSWHRNHGPELLKTLRETVEARTQPVPTLLKGKPLRDWLQNIFRAIKAYGSRHLVGDLEKYEADFLQLLNLTYEEILERFRQNKLFSPHIQIYS